MKTIQLDDNKNIQLFNGNISIIEGIEALKQDLTSQLSICNGENDFDTEQGIDYENNILGKMGGIDYIKGQIRNEILKNEEVKDIQEIEIIADNTKLNINTFINTIYGEIKI